ncbi:MAG: FAD:protein FMN transferase [Bacilli bacterium]|nr:FAD:protein FMN transferase [Bacilli bacterium]
MKKRLSLLLIAPLLLACSESTFSCSALVFHSFFSCKYVSSRGECNKEMIDMVNRIDALADPYTNYGGNTLYYINSTNEPVEVEPHLFNLMKTALDLYEKTEHNFNPYIGKITSLWKNTLFGDDEDMLFDGPTVSSIEEAKSFIPALLEEARSTRVVLDESKSTIQRIGSGHIDLGGLTKGYSVEETERILEKYKIEKYLINGGQSSLGLGKSQDGGNFKVNLMYSKEENENLFSLSKIDTSTSAIYEQSVTVDGITYSHIINPNTGMPLSDYSMAFLSGEDSALLDAFSTSCMIAGPEKSEEWSKKYNFSYSLYEDVGGFTKLVKESESLTKARI